jgi:dTDP-4-dehydrorhamnose reductase
MIWLIGNKGMLGYDVERFLKERGLIYWASDKEIDISDYKALEKFGKDKNIEWVINCAGYTKVDKSEEEIDEAFRINKDGIRNIALFSAKRQIRLIHISTDYVFDGRQEGGVVAYREDDETNPINIYGKSKLAGEKEIKKILNEYFIVRTAWLYGLNGNNFVYTMLKLFKEKEVIRVVDDQRGSPTYTVDLADIILKIIETGSDKFGIYHFTNKGVTNWYEFTKTIYGKAKRLGLLEDNKKVEIKPIKTENYPTAAKRPRYSGLSKEKIKKEFNLKIRNWNEALEDFLTTLSLQTK